MDEKTFEPEEGLLPERRMLPEDVEDAEYSEEFDDRVTSIEDVSEATDEGEFESNEASEGEIDADGQYYGNSAVDDYGVDEDENFP